MSENSREKPEYTPFSSGNAQEGTSCSMSSSRGVIENQQNPNLNEVLLNMNKTIHASNQLLVEFLSSQRKCTRVDDFASESDSDGSLEPPAKMAKRGVSTQSVAPHRLPSESAHSDADKSIGSPAPIAGHINENRPATDDAISLFGEQDIDEGVNASENLQSQEDFLTEVTNAIATEKPTGPPISEYLAKILNDKFHIELELAQRKGVIEKYLTPENCTGFYRPRINMEIWASITSASKISDRGYMALQDALVTASSAVALSIDDILKFREKKSDLDCQAIVARQIDIITLLGHVSKELSYRRKEALRPAIHPEFRGACGRTTKPTTLLFGDDLPKTLQELRTTNRIFQNFSSHSSRRGQYYKSNSDRTNNNSFLLQRGRTNFPPRRNQTNYPLKKRSTKHWKQ